MHGFAQHVRIQARPGSGDRLEAKFLETLDLLADEPACLLTIVSRDPADPDVVFLTEAWSSADEHARVVASPSVVEWAADMPELTAGPPQVQPIAPSGWLARSPRGPRD